MKRRYQQEVSGSMMTTLTRSQIRQQKEEMMSKRKQDRDLKKQKFMKELEYKKLRQHGSYV